MEAFPQVYAPDTVVRGEPFEVSVVFNSKPSTPGAPQLAVVVEQDQRVEMEVEVLLPEDSAIEADGVPTIGQLRLADSGQSPRLSFRLVGRRCGLASVDVVFRYNHVERLRLAVPIYVEASAVERTSSEPRVASGELAVSATSKEPVVVMRIERRFSEGPSVAWRVTLLGPAELVPFGISVMHEVPASIQELLVEQCRKFEHDFDPQLKPELLESRLRRVGLSLAETLLPPEIQNALVELPEKLALHIEADDAWAPWEMIRLGGSDSGFFIGERFAVTRWLREGSRRDRLCVGPAVLVAPTDGGLSVTEERKALRRLLGQAPLEMRSLAEVSNFLDGNLHAEYGRCHFLHFAAHGVLPTGDPHGGRILLQDQRALLVTDVAPPGIGEDIEKAPLLGSCVFINACQAGISGRASLTGHAGWAGVLSKAGVAATIVPSWSVYDSTASSFAVAFYDEIGGGVTLGEAARRARVWAREEGNPDRLAFSVFALPELRLERESGE
ncbi:MAG: CHAT domain-containing protein [Myxococcota bacterium]